MLDGVTPVLPRKQDAYHTHLAMLECHAVTGLALSERDHEPILKTCLVPERVMMFGALRYPGSASFRPDAMCCWTCQSNQNLAWPYFHVG